MADERVRIVISGKDDASDEIKNVSKSLGKLDSPMAAVSRGLKPINAGFATLGKTLALGIGAGIVGIGAAFTGAAVTGIEFNARLEQTTVAFTTLLKSGEKAQSFLNDLQAFAASTPFEFPELADASQRLLAMGFAADTILPMMTDIGNAVAALGGGAPEVDRVVVALGQMQAKGKASAEELGQLAELGIPIWDMLAKKLGVDVATAMEMVTDKSVDATTAIAAFREGSQGAFGGAMLAQSATFSGQLSTIKDNVMLALGAFTGPLFADAKQSLGDLGTIVSDPKFQEFAKTMGEKIAPAVRIARDAVITLVDALSGNWKDRAQTIEPIHRVFGEIGLIVHETIILLREVWGVLRDGEHPTEGITGSLTDLANALRDVRMTIRDAGRNVADFNTKLQPLADILNAVDSAMRRAGSATREFMLALGTWQATKLKELVEWLGRMIGNLTRLLGLIPGGGSGFSSGTPGGQAAAPSAAATLATQGMTAGFTPMRPSFAPRGLTFAGDINVTVEMGGLDTRGTPPEQLRSAAYAGTHEAITALVSSLRTQTAQAGTQGPRR